MGKSPQFFAASDLFPSIVRDLLYPKEANWKVIDINPAASAAKEQ